jgi:hypothetical protein
MQTIDNIYDAASKIGDTSVRYGSLVDLSNTHSVPDCTYRWPLIDGEIANAVEKQLQESVSIYDNGGIFGEFERAWKKHHGLTESFALLHNSGTNALQALYFAAQLQPGDEVGSPQHLTPVVPALLTILPGHLPRLQLPRNLFSSYAIWGHPSLLRRFL